MYKNIIERDNPAVYHSPADTRCTHLVHNDDKSFKLGTLTLPFETYLPTKPVTLEAWVYPTHLVGRSKLLAFDDNNGLFLEPGVLKLTLGDSTLSYPIENRITHVTATLSVSEMTLYVNGERYDSALFTVPQFKTSSLSTSSNSTSRIFVSGLAVYAYPLTQTAITAHYNFAETSAPVFPALTSNADNYYEFNRDSINLINQLRFTQGNWPGLISNVNSYDVLSSSQVDDEIQEGYWQFSHASESNERIAVLTWSGNAIIQKQQSNQWVDLKQNEPVSLNTEDIFRAFFPKGVVTQLTELTLNVYDSISIGNFQVTSGAPGEYFYPRVAQELSGLTGTGILKLTEEEEYPVKAIHGWFRHDTDDSPFTTPAGRLYINGVERDYDANYDRNKWIHITKVLSTETKSDVNLFPNLKGGVGLMGTLSTTPDAAQLYNSFFTTAYKVEEATVTTVSEQNAKIYGHDWTVHSV